MQRGAAFRDEPKMSEKEFHFQTRITLTKADLAHFQFGAFRREEFIEGMRPIVRQMARNGFRKPFEVAKLLNKWNVKTACGAMWSRRLAWFLLGFLFEKEADCTSGKTDRAIAHARSVLLIAAARSNGSGPDSSRVAVSMTNRSAIAPTFLAANDVGLGQQNLAELLSTRFKVSVRRV